MPQPPMPPTNHQLMPVTTPTTRPTIPLAQPMPHDTVATLNRKDTEDSMWEKSEIRPTGNPACLKMYQFILIYSILILYHFIFYTMTLGILSIIWKGIVILFYFILSNSFHHFWTINMNKNNPTNLLNFHQFCTLLIAKTALHKCPRTKI